ncbi:MAG: flagellar biosynthesis protein FlhF [Leptospirales bacterium]|nr:flagellar biosynthesis protein FlhF [Leptospirales bacterium]
MKYIKIIAENYQEAMKKLRMEHGDEAMPISHKYVKQGGLFNSKLFAKEVVELTAFVKDRKILQPQMMKKSTIDFIVDDRNEIHRLNNARDIANRTSVASSLSSLSSKGEFKGEFKEEVNREFNVDSIKRSIDTANENLNSLKSHETLSDSDDFLIKNITEVSPELETIVRNNSSNDIAANIEREVNEIKAALNKLIEGSSKNRTEVRDEDKNFSNVREILRSNDFDPEDCEIIIKEVRDSISKEDQKDKYKIEKSLKDIIKNKIITTGPIKKGNKKKVIMFIGPTGVGKTTTMAKLGAINSLREGKKVSFITIDNYRIAATEQLKKYAEIMRIPVHVISDQRHFRDVIASEKSDIIMVDTSGRSHNNELKISEIKSFADNVEYDFEKILCVSANTKKNDLKEIFKAFDIIKFDSVIITKVDETSFIGNVIDVADKYNKPISYFTDGQEVPNDIHIANSDEIVDIIIGN